MKKYLLQLDEGIFKGVKHWAVELDRTINYTITKMILEWMDANRPSGEQTKED